MGKKLGFLGRKKNKKILAGCPGDGGSYSAQVDEMKKGKKGIHTHLHHPAGESLSRDEKKCVLVGTVGRAHLAFSGKEGREECPWG